MTVCRAELPVSWDFALRNWMMCCRMSDAGAMHPGSAAFIGLGVYSYYTGMSNLRKQETAGMLHATKYKMGSRQLGIATISATLVGMGIYRALN